MTIRFKILLACFALVAITGSLGIFAWLQERELGALATGIYDNAVVGVSYAQKAHTDFVRLASDASIGNPVSRHAMEPVLEELDVARERAITPVGRAFARQIRADIAGLGAPNGAVNLNARLERLDAELGDLAAKFTADSFIYRVKTDRAITRTTFWTKVAVGAAILFALICAFLLEEAIVPPIRRAVTIASSVAAGELNNEIRAGKGRSETTRLLGALAEMQHSVAESVKRAEAVRISEAARMAAEYDSDAAHRANKAKSEFLATMSHELRTPLNAILGFSELIHAQMLGPLPAAYAGYAGDIHTSGRHLLDLINDILDLSKLEAGKFEIHDEAVDLKAVLSDCLLLMRGQAEKSLLVLIEQFAPHVPLIRADGRHMKQIALNLLSNAIKFTPRGGEVTVALHASRTGLVEFAITDSGIGMTPAEIEVALMPFGQIDSKIARRHQGTGLGLSITRALVEMHGGKLRLESEPGVGTTVSVAIPVARAASATQAAA